MAECPANQVSWWECPTARRLHHEMVQAAHRERTMPLFTEPGTEQAARDAFNAHMLSGHDEEE